ncbi:unnamed protein product [Eretmochelys imbricata]
MAKEQLEPVCYSTVPIWIGKLRQDRGASDPCTELGSNGSLGQGSPSFSQRTVQNQAAMEACGGYLESIPSSLLISLHGVGKQWEQGSKAAEKEGFFTPMIPLQVSGRSLESEELCLKSAAATKEAGVSS